MIRRRGPDTVRISKVKGHADEAMARHGQVREVDRLGNNAADEAADFGRRRVGNLQLLMLVVTCLGFVISGILSFLTFIGFLLLSPELWLIMTVVLVLLLIP